MKILMMKILMKPFMTTLPMINNLDEHESHNETENDEYYEDDEEYNEDYYNRNHNKRPRRR